MKHKRTAATTATAFALAVSGSLIASPAAMAATGDPVCEKFGNSTADGYIAQNNAWGTDQEQCIVVDGSGFKVTSAEGEAPTDSGAPKSYPSLVAGSHYGLNSDGYVAHKAGAIPADMRTKANLTIPESGWEGNASYDLWLDAEKQPEGQASDTEIMVWLYTTDGAPQPIGEIVGSVDIEGTTFTVWQGKGADGKWDVVSYVRDGGTTEADLPIKPFVDDSIARGATEPGSFLSSVQLGFEPTKGGEGLGVEGFAVGSAAEIAQADPATVDPVVPVAPVDAAADAPLEGAQAPADEAPVVIDVTQAGTPEATPEAPQPIATSQDEAPVTAPVKRYDMTTTTNPEPADSAAESGSPAVQEKPVKSEAEARAALAETEAADEPEAVVEAEAAESVVVEPDALDDGEETSDTVEGERNVDAAPPAGEGMEGEKKKDCTEHKGETYDHDHAEHHRGEDAAPAEVNEEPAEGEPEADAPADTEEGFTPRSVGGDGPDTSETTTDVDQPEVGEAEPEADVVPETDVVDEAPAAEVVPDVDVPAVVEPEPEPVPVVTEASADDDGEIVVLDEPAEAPATKHITIEVTVTPATTPEDEPKVTATYSTDGGEASAPVEVTEAPEVAPDGEASAA